MWLNIVLVRSHSGKELLRIRDIGDCRVERKKRIKQGGNVMKIEEKEATLPEADITPHEESSKTKKANVKAKKTQEKNSKKSVADSRPRKRPLEGDENITKRPKVPLKV